MTRPEEHAYSSHISYCRALEAYCDKIEAELAELEAHTKTLTQAAYAARLERDVAWQRCKELEAQEPVAWTWVDRKGWKEYSDTPHDTYTCTPLYKRGAA